jgi:hypothetical protein
MPGPRSLTSFLNLVKPSEADRNSWNIPTNNNWDRVDAALSNGAIAPADVDTKTGKSTSRKIRMNPYWIRNLNGTVTQVVAPPDPITLPPNVRSCVFLSEGSTTLHAATNFPDWGVTRLAVVNTDAGTVLQPIEDARYALQTDPQLFFWDTRYFVPFGSGGAGGGTLELDPPVTTNDGFEVQQTPDFPNPADIPPTYTIVYNYADDDIYVCLPSALNNVGRIIVVRAQPYRSSPLSTGSIHIKERSTSAINGGIVFGPMKGLRLRWPGEQYWFVGTSEDGYDLIGYCPPFDTLIAPA